MASRSGCKRAALPKGFRDELMEAFRLGMWIANDDGGGEANLDSFEAEGHVDIADPVVGDLVPRMHREHSF